MPRIPFVPADVKEPKALVDAVRARRGGELLELDRLLLHSPALTEGWNFHLNQVRTKGGGTEEQGKALRNPEAAMRDTRLFDDVERAVLALTYEMTEHVKVSDATFAAARRALGSEKLLVELVGVV